MAKRPPWKPKPNRRKEVLREIGEHQADQAAFLGVDPSCVSRLHSRPPPSAFERFLIEAWMMIPEPQRSNIIEQIAHKRGLDDF